MTHDIQVTCLLNKYWDPATDSWKGDLHSGTLIDITMQTADDLSGKLIPVGIILLEDGTFQSVPMELLTKV